MRCQVQAQSASNSAFLGPRISCVFTQYHVQAVLSLAMQTCQDCEGLAVMATPLPSGSAMSMVGNWGHFALSSWSAEG